MKVLTNLDLTKNQLLNPVMQQLASAPSNPVMGQFYFNTVDETPYWFNGVGWVDFDNSGGGGNADTLNEQLPSYYLDRTNHTGTQAAATISDLAATVKAYRLDEFAVPTAGVAMNSQKITGLGTPTENGDAATKLYVDTAVSNLVDSAPGVLDTLNELAAALDDDPNFATTVASGIAAAKDRANHTGTQTASTISDFSTAADARITAREYVASIGNGSDTDITVTHNLNSQDVIVQVREVGSPYAVVIPDIEMATVNTVILRFGTAPTSNQYRVMIIKIG
jgi:hypothetical protein